ncbi:MAG: RNA methyltransferase [Prevotella sp.]|nr:RNA methyltransferase [Prevotella sp.]MBR4481826.1 RNA methyltransferase [Prevotella sp.]
MEENIITSVQNARIKHVVALQQKSSLRREEGLFVVEGQREIEHCLEGGYEVVEVFSRKEEGVRRQESGVRREVEYLVTPQVYEKMAYRGSTEGIIAVVRCKEHALSNLSPLTSYHSPLIIVLESVEKPGNIGAILRSADAANVDAVIVCDPLTDLYNPNLIRASIGAIFTVPTAVCTSQECIAFLKERGIRILTAQLQDSYEYYDYDMRPATAIVMGTESTGLTQQWREAADAHIRIPMLGRLDSLNVSVSAAILMFEAVRQRKVSAP